MHSVYDIIVLAEIKFETTDIKINKYSNNDFTPKEGTFLCKIKKSS